jgi:hypothetical protein
MRKWLTIGVMLIVAWIVLKIVFKVVGAAVHLLLILGLLFLAWTLVRRFIGSRRRGV